jgi:hypothetical protein
MIKWIKSIFWRIKYYDKLQAAMYRMVEESAARQRASIKRDLLPLLNGNKDRKLKQYVNNL